MICPKVTKYLHPKVAKKYAPQSNNKFAPQSNMSCTVPLAFTQFVNSAQDTHRQIHVLKK